MTMEAQSWRMIAASVGGSGHVRAGLECQDTYLWRKLLGNVFVAAIADGAGSACFGKQGAHTAVESGVESLAGGADVFRRSESPAIWQRLFQDALSTAKAAVEGEATHLGVESRDLASTLILVVARPGLVGGAQIGDGAVVVRSSDGSILSLTHPPAEDSINTTTFLTSEGAVDSAQIRLWQGIPSHVAAITDGLQLLALRMPEGAPHEPFFSPLFKFADESRDEADAAPRLEGFLRSPRIASATDDDLTLLLAVLGPHES